MDELIVKTLNYIGVRKIKVYKNRVMCTCPFENGHNNGIDRKPSLSIDKQIGVWHCFGCGISGASIRGLVYKWCQQNGVDYDKVKSELGLGDSVSKLRKAIDIIMNMNYEDRRFVGKPNNNNDEELPLSDELKKYITDNAGKVPKYILDRGVSLDVAKEALLGYDEKLKKIIFPVRRTPDGEFVGIITRGIKKTPDYMYNKGFRKNYLYLEYETWIKPFSGGIILVEGAIDALVLRKFGFNGVAILGSSISDAQVKKVNALCDRILENFEDAAVCVYIMMDADAPGRVAAEEVYNKLIRIIKYPVIKLNLEDGDPSDIQEKEKVQELIKRAIT